jgi:hypothetical protein
MEPTLSSETSDFNLQTPGKFPKEHRLHSKHGESLKTTKGKFVCILSSKAYVCIRDTPTLILNFGTRRRKAVDFRPRPLYHGERMPVHIEWEAEGGGAFPYRKSKPDPLALNLATVPRMLYWHFSVIIVTDFDICGSVQHAFLVKIIPTRCNNCVLFFA